MSTESSSKAPAFHLISGTELPYFSVYKIPLFSKIVRLTIEVGPTHRSQSRRERHRGAYLPKP